jgi:putative glutamine amidotransferase
LGKVLYDTVNTYHHQAVDKLARTFKITARSSDGIIEAYEWKHPKNKAFLLAVQFHPEKLTKENPLALPIAIRFINEARKYCTSFQKK